MTVSMKQRRVHRWLGTTLLLPFIAWSLTAMFFLLRPAYTDAYAALPLGGHELPESVVINVRPDWQELRLLHSVLGEHLLVRGSEGWQHLDAATGEPFPVPTAADLQRLLEAGFSVNPSRYGNVVSVDGWQAHTDTGVTISVDWDRFSARQSGRDTRWIDRIYAIHYLRWTGHAVVDQILGITGLLLLLYMTWSGGRMVFGDLSGKRSGDNRQPRESESRGLL